MFYNKINQIEPKTMINLDLETSKIIFDTINNLFLYRIYMKQKKADNPNVFSATDLILFYGKKNHNNILNKSELSQVLKLMYDNQLLYKQDNGNEVMYGFAYENYSFTNNLGTFPY